MIVCCKYLHLCYRQGLSNSPSDCHMSYSQTLAEYEKFINEMSVISTTWKHCQRLIEKYDEKQVRHNLINDCVKVLISLNYITVFALYSVISLVLCYLSYFWASIFYLMVVNSSIVTLWIQCQF